ncbi:coiled-coil domain-containing protein 152-like [Lytechinus pictus]|uniref:coiled-coil domain-containing protein 152-like n=1 Tax=Lytechinus pictus TaxID=7653 RepID=UPI0030B9B75A
MESSARGIDLDKVVEEFNSWQRLHERLVQEKEGLQNEVSLLQREYEASKERHTQTMEDFKQTQEMVTKLQNMLKLKCNLEDENQELKDKVTNVIDELAITREEHKLAMSQSDEKMDELYKTHRQEIEDLLETTTAEREKEVGILKESLHAKMNEVSKLHKQLAELEREKHTEVTRVRLEYDAKLLKLQKEITRAQQQSSKTANRGSDIYRQKLMNAKAESDQQISSLKRTISDLQRRLDVQTGGTYGPKRKF